jgi:hypothetical protein
MTVELTEGLRYRDPKHAGLHEIVTVDEEADMLRVDSWGDEQTDGTWDERCTCPYSLSGSGDDIRQAVEQSEIIKT